MTKEHTLDQLSRLCAAFLVIVHAAEILSRKIESLSATQRQVMTHDNKVAVTGILQAAQKMQHHMQHFSDWAIAAAVTEKGEVGSISSYDVLIRDASDFLCIFLKLFNASYNDDDARKKTEELLDSLTDKTLIDTSIIESLKTKV